MAAVADSGSAHVRIVVTAQGDPLPDAVVRSGRIGARTDQQDTAVLTLPAGQRTIIVSKLGFRSDSVTLVLGAGADSAVAFALVEQVAQVAPVVVTATRTEQRVEAVPLRVEVLAGEDIGEKNAVRPGDLTQMVAEIPGVRVQQTAPGLGGATLRVQGFRGEYTEFLTDGLPLGSAAEAASSLVQQPPLDLAQVEVIKGTSSALYGAFGARRGGELCHATAALSRISGDTRCRYCWIIAPHTRRRGIHCGPPHALARVHATCGRPSRSHNGCGS